MPADIVEDVIPGEAPLGYLERIASAKLAAVRERLEREGPPADAPAGVAGILVADTTVVIDDSIVGKPADVAEAVVTLNRLVGRTHTVFTSYLLWACPSHSASPSPGARSAVSPPIARTVQSKVSLRSASAQEVHAYAATGEGLDKAGAYAAQGLGAFLVEAVSGSYTNVVGLPVCELVSDLLRGRLLESFPMSSETLSPEILSSEILSSQNH